MSTTRSARARVALMAVLAVAVPGAAASAAASAAPATAPQTAPAAARAAAPAADRTSPAEARRVDRFPTPRPTWFDCSMMFSPGSECTTVGLPLDYDRPLGARTTVAMLRQRATDPGRRIGTLFLNPGGPGGSGVGMAADSQFFLSEAVRARFDIVGFDPRGTNFSSNVRCWRNMGAQSGALDSMDVAFPYTTAEELAYVRSSKAAGRACSTTGLPLTGSVSTAEVARDMDVLRRTVGDQRLTYLGFSYGSYLGTVYANLFPDRVRAIAVDGILDPLAWSGAVSGTTSPVTVRLGSGTAGARAMTEILRRCARKGPAYCNLASRGDPQAIYTRTMAVLKRGPIEVEDPDTGEVFTISYADAVGVLLGGLYSPEAGSQVDRFLSFLDEIVSGGRRTPSAARTEAARELRTALRAAQPETAASGFSAAAASGGFPYDNGFEAFTAVLCSDSRNPADASRWPDFADQADRTGPGFARLWTWASAPCASATWQVRDEDAYFGPFTRRTQTPLLVVGNTWDPATPYAGAVALARVMPGSRLVSSDSWGHTAYGSSDCVTIAVDRYLLGTRLPAVGTRCVGDVQPFTEPLDDSGRARLRSQARTVDQLPPVVPPLPGARPRS